MYTNKKNINTKLKFENKIFDTTIMKSVMDSNVGDEYLPWRHSKMFINKKLKSLFKKDDIFQAIL